MNTDYVVAKYLRISDDDGRYGDSQSIEGQRDLITEFVKSHPELKTARIVEFADDGYSGTNFKRPNITELLQRAQKGEINCIVVKDFSRFGRSYIEVGDYLEQIFPFLRVRFISINDLYDSDVDGNSAGDVSIAFKHLCNDYYSKDLSRKIRAGIQTKWEAGHCHSNQLPLGYIKSGDSIVIDEKAAEIIRYIFQRAMDGNTVKEIAKILNEESLPTPMQYKYENGLIKNTIKQPKRYVWVYATVYSIITDISYTGSLVQGRWRCSVIGSRRNSRLPREQWHVIPNHHEPIISQKDFEKASLCIGTGHKNRAKHHENTGLLGGKIRCGGCGYTLKKCSTKELSYSCGYKSYIETHSCLSGRVKAAEIETVLLASISRLFETNNIQKENRHVQEEQRTSASMDILRQLQAVQKQVDSVLYEKLALYTSYSEDAISKDVYFQKRDMIESTLRELSEKMAALENKRLEIAPFASDINAMDNLTFGGQLTRELMDALVEFVTVFEDNRMEIKWKFADKVRQLK